MNNVNWFKPGKRISWWTVIGLSGALMIILGLFKIITEGFSSPTYAVLYLSITAAGIGVLTFSFKMGMKSICALMESAGLGSPIDAKKLSNLVYEKRLLIRGPKIVVIGGGTGLSTMLRGLKYYTSNITAIVTVADDGGSSGVLREELGILPPGDIRNCILALADTEPVMEELLQYRFTDGMLKGQSFGNLFLAAMDGISNNFEEAIKKMSDVLAVTGQVLPVTLADVKLFAELDNGVIIEGESEISKRIQYKDVPIKRVFIEPSKVLPLKEAINAIDEADAIVLGPGSLYTSIIPNLLVDDIAKHLGNSSALKIYVSNIMTQPGETAGYSVCDHLDAIQQYGSRKMIDYAIINNGSIPKGLYGKYIEDGAREVVVDKNEISSRGIEIVEDDLVFIYKNLVRHNSNKLARIIMNLILDKRITKDRKRLIESYYLGERLREIGR